MTLFNLYPAQLLITFKIRSKEASGNAPYWGIARNNIRSLASAKRAPEE